MPKTRSNPDYTQHEAEFKLWMDYINLWLRDRDAARPRGARRAVRQSRQRTRRLMLLLAWVLLLLRLLQLVHHLLAKVLG